MLLVITAHAFALCDPARIAAWAFSNLLLITGAASVAFMFTSGMITTFLMHFGDDSPHARWRFIKRGIFLILVVHPLILFVTLDYFRDPRGYFYEFTHDFQITDTIGLCLLIAPFVIRRTGRGVRLALIIALLVFTQATLIWWHPQSAAAKIITEFFFGSMPDTDSIISVGWPLIPWLAIFLSGSLVGEFYVEARRGTLAPREFSRRLWKAGFLQFVLFLALCTAYWWLKHSDPFSWTPATFLAIYPTRTTALLPGYLAGILAIVAMLVRYVDADRHYNRPLWALSIFGRNSLFVFVTQFVVIWTLPAALGFKGSLGYGGLVATIAIGTIVCLILAYMYGRWRGRISSDDYLRITGRA